jgi:hypothetical protein
MNDLDGRELNWQAARNIFAELTKPTSAIKLQPYAPTGSLIDVICIRYLPVQWRMVLAEFVGNTLLSTKSRRPPP